MKENFNNIVFYFMLLLLSSNGVAGEVKDIIYENTMLTIHHQGCRLLQPIVESYKLIIPLATCTAQTGEKNLNKEILHKIHWAQHDSTTVWIVASFAEPYRFEISSGSGIYNFCFPQCEKNLLSFHTLIPEKLEEPKLETINDSKILFFLDGISFQIPLENMLIDEFLDRSIGFTPKDVIRDGLPHFSSERDDWKGTPRKHEGYDIYIDQANVLAAADGVVVKVASGNLAGLYIKLRHSTVLYTLYIHLKHAFVQEGQTVHQGEIIGKVDGPSGNAIAPQLHFELKIKNSSVDPLPYIEEFYQTVPEITQKIIKYKEQLQYSILERKKKVREFLRSR